MRSAIGKRDSDLLILLSKATRLLQSCPLEDVKDVLRNLQVQIDYYGSCLHESTVDDISSSSSSSSSMEDGDGPPVNFLILLLGYDSQVVAHAVAKTLLALSNSLMKSRYCWERFLLHLWTVAQTWLSATSSHCCECISVSAGYDRPGVRFHRKYTCSSIRQQTVHSHGETDLLACSHSVQLLQRILKDSLKSSGVALDNVQTFLKLFANSIIGLATAICTKQNLSRSYPNHQQLLKRQKYIEEEPLNVSCSEHSNGCLPSELLLGSVLMLVCTVTRVMANSTPNSSFLGNSARVRLFLGKLEELVNLVSPSVFARHVECEGKSCISPFLRYKLLMIMMRLSDCYEVRPSLALSCLNLLQTSGACLLRFSLHSSTAIGAGSIDDSPFMASLVRNGSQNIKTSFAPSSIVHLQRRALYILLKIASTCYGSKPSNATPVKQSVTRMLVEWLSLQAESSALLTIGSGSIQDCTFLDHLAMSLVQFYLDEDDLMLKMLLQLSNQPSPLSSLITQEKSKESAKWRATLMAFTPERIFHAFLAAIHHNSSVLLDLLISEDSGSSCVVYLMRSIRYIIDSWPEFVKSAPWTSLGSQRRLPVKRGEFNGLTDRSVAQTATVCLQAGSRTNDSDKSKLTCRSQLTSDKGGSKSDGGTSATEDDIAAHNCNLLDGSNTLAQKVVVRKVANCLLQLKLSIERLHRHSLFPYNPSLLVKRLEAVMKNLSEFLPCEEADDVMIRKVFS